VKASELVEIAGTDYIETLRRCGGYYATRLGEDGRRLSPLVGYAGKYEDPYGEMLQWVGDVYYNFAKVEEFPHVLKQFGSHLAEDVGVYILGEIDYVLGAPMGGIAIAVSLARHLDCRFAFAEKKVTALATPESREKSKLLLSRHEIVPGSKVVLVEDVCNNFSTTEELVALVRSGGSEVIGIACELNRSPETKWGELPVVSLRHIPTAQYRQHDPLVAVDIQASNVVWKPKDEWARLMAAMKGGD